MTPRYYELPIKFDLLMSRNVELPLCDLKKSIAQNIYLIITSRFRENRYDDSFGCELWDMDFELVHNESMWVERIRKSVLNSIINHETRIYSIYTDIQISQEEKIFSLNKSMGVKKRLTIKVDCKIKETGEDYMFNTNIYLSPISLD